MKNNYLPNNAKQVSEFMDGVGDYTSSLHGRTLQAAKGYSEKQKKILTGEDFLDWLDKVGVDDADLGEVLSLNLTGRIKSGNARIRQVRIDRRLTTEVSDLFRPIQSGTRTAWQGDYYYQGEKISQEEAKKLGLALSEQDMVARLNPNEALWMPKGNLRFFSQTQLDAMPWRLHDILGKAGEMSDDLMEEILELTEEMSRKTGIGITANVPTYAVPRDIVDDLTRVSANMANPDGFVDFIDEGLKWWRNLAILSPGFHTRNAISSGFQNYLAGVNPMRYADASAIMKYDDPMKMIMGKRVQEWRRILERYGVSGGSFIGQDVGAIRKGGSVSKGAEKIFGFSRDVGSRIEDFHRTALFLDDMVKQGAKGTPDPVRAWNKVKKFHFDYGELTDTERGLFRRVMPFYTWTRKNVPLQLEQIFKNPKKYSRVAQLKSAIEGSPDGQGNPEWWKDMDVWKTKFQDKDENKHAVMVGMPYSDLTQIANNPTGMTGPLGSAFNIMQGRDPFFDEPISEFPGERKGWMNAELQYIVKQLIPIAKRYGFDMMTDVPELAKYAKGEDYDFNKAARGISKFVGVRLLKETKDDAHKRRQYQLMDQLRNFNKYNKQEEEREKRRAPRARR